MPKAIEARSPYDRGVPSGLSDDQNGMLLIDFARGSAGALNASWPPKKNRSLPRRTNSPVAPVLSSGSLSISDSPGVTPKLMEPRASFFST